MRRVLVVGALVLAAAAVRAEMSDSDVQAAIEAGTKAKKVEPIELKKGRVACIATTPGLRVRLAAYHAKKEYKTLAAADVTEDMRAGVLEIACPSMKVLPERNEIASVRAIVIIPKDGAPIQPMMTEPTPQSYSNAYGATWDASGMVATFPLDSLQVGSVLHVIYTTKVAHSVLLPLKEDISIEIKSKVVAEAQ